MSRAILPRAAAYGARILSGCRVQYLLRRKQRVTGVIATLEHEDGRVEQVRIDAQHVFVCAGPIETPALLKRSGIRLHVGDTLCIHPMLKVAARFDERIDAHREVLPLLQVKGFWPEISLGGAFFTPGHLAMLLSENWPQLHGRMDDLGSLAMYYVAVRGRGRGSVQPMRSNPNRVAVRYQLTHDDLRDLSAGLARLASLLLAGGARAVHPAVHGLPEIRSEVEAVRWLDQLLPKSALSLTTVHAFSTCPMGERLDRCATDSFGRLRDFENVHLNDASLLPDSPGVNPQGSVMAFARRNVLRFCDEGK
jgi:choline dehydrogenase-like flavoprotein